MKTTTLALPVLLVSSFILAGCSGPLASLQSKIPFLGKSADAPQTGIEQVAEAGKMSVMIATGKSGICTVTNRENGEKIELMVKGKKMKFMGSDFGGPQAENLMDPPQPTKAKTVGYFLNDSEYTYMWEQGATTGFKTKLPSEEEMKKMAETMPATEDEGVTSETNSPNITQFEQNDMYTINCDMKDLPDSEFAPPANVEFMDFSQMTQDWEKSMPTGEEGSSMPGSPMMELPEGMELPEEFMGDLPEGL